MKKISNFIRKIENKKINIKIYKLDEFDNILINFNSKHNMDLYIHFSDIIDVLVTKNLKNFDNFFEYLVNNLYLKNDKPWVKIIKYSSNINYKNL